jgi:serine/threonine protein kinase
MILAGGHAGAADLARFQTEAHAIARLQHPNIVQVYEVGEHEGKPFLALEFCAGGSLAQKLNGTPLPPREAAALVETLARAMRAAHEQHVIHRDLKPANVLLAADGTPKVTDFGLAKKLDEAGQTQSGAVLGTPSYMAPEQAGGKSPEIGPLADVYALGAILYECLTGRPPFKAATTLEGLIPSQLRARDLGDGAARRARRSSGACCRRGWDRLTNPRPRAAVEEAGRAEGSRRTTGSTGNQGAAAEASLTAAGRSAGPARGGARRFRPPSRPQSPDALHENSSRLLLKIAKNLTRSSRGVRASSASCNTRRLNSSQLRSRSSS